MPDQYVQNIFFLLFQDSSLGSFEGAASEESLSASEGPNGVRRQQVKKTSNPTLCGICGKWITICPGLQAAQATSAAASCNYNQWRWRPPLGLQGGLWLSGPGDPSERDRLRRQPALAAGRFGRGAGEGSSVDGGGGIEVNEASRLLVC